MTNNLFIFLRSKCKNIYSNYIMAKPENPWLSHVKKTMKSHPQLKFKQVLQEAKKSWHGSSESNTKSKKSKKSKTHKKHKKTNRRKTGKKGRK